MKLSHMITGLAVAGLLLSPLALRAEETNAAQPATPAQPAAGEHKHPIKHARKEVREER
jgi:hypothetical protein